MTKYASTVSLVFPAGHQLHGGDNPCGDRAHGHLYRVDVTFEREGFPDADLIEYARVRAAVLSLVMELRNRSLNEMLGPHVPNVYGVCSFFVDRLKINVPITRVEVHEDSPSGPRASTELESDL